MLCVPWGVDLASYDILPTFYLRLPAPLEALVQESALVSNVLERKECRYNGDPLPDPPNLPSSAGVDVRKNAPAEARIRNLWDPVGLTAASATVDTRALHTGRV